MRFLFGSIGGLLLLALGACSPAPPQGEETGGRLEIVKNRGKLICGVNGEVPGFSFVSENGDYAGMDADFCRAVAAAIFKDGAKVEFRQLSAQERFSAVQTGEVDLLSRNTTWTVGRDSAVKLDMGPVYFYDGQGLMVKKDSGVQSLSQLANKSVCVLAGTTSEQNLADQMAKAGVKTYNPVVADGSDALYAAYQEGRCEAVTSDRSQLVARRSILPDPQNHVVLDLLLSKEPLAPAVREGDSRWFNVVQWVAFALIEAEELGITSQNIGQFQTSADPNVRRFLGLEETLGTDLGLPNDYVQAVIAQVGNYGEIYERHVGKPFQLPRGLNALWTKGGLHYSPPFR
ncbi:MAG: transporter substrate-binding domain-containing protein [Cyanobacteria bacterium RI_101]|nr:transporter substrate-binding domain-containing protein [Cyanobacteria bacterium RI_101]